MSSSVIAFHPHVRALSPGRGHVRERSVRRRVGLVWALLFINVLTFYAATWNGQPLLLPIPHRIGQLITQGALPVALLLALTINRRMQIRPNVFLCMMTLLVIEALVSSIHPTGHVIGTVYRIMRFTGFVSVLWLLTPWWGRRDMLLVKCQLAVLSVVLGSVLLGLVVAPGRALAGGRLSGTLWPMPPTEVADFAALSIGLVVMLWLCGLMRGRVTPVLLGLAGVVLVLAHSRTELIGMTAGILVASMSLFTARARVRRFFAGISVAASIGIILFSGLVSSWLARGQKGQQLTALTGRTTVWTAIAKAPHNTFQAIFGHGLSNKSFNGLPIDSTWLAAYWDLGVVGVVGCATLLLFVLVAAYLTPRSPQRALAVFLGTYLLVRSFTEIAIGDASVDLPLLTLAASLLLPALPKARPG